MKVSHKTNKTHTAALKGMDAIELKGVILWIAENLEFAEYGLYTQTHNFKTIYDIHWFELDEDQYNKFLKEYVNIQALNPGII